MIYFTMHLIIVLIVTFLQYNIKHILLLIKKKISSSYLTSQA